MNYNLEWREYSCISSTSPYESWDESGEAGGQIRACLGGLRLRLQNWLLLEPFQMMFWVMAPTMQLRGAPEIALTGAIWTRWSWEIVAPAGSARLLLALSQLWP